MMKSPLPGGAPWRILRDCPSLLHNSLNAATKGMAGTRCICPRGLYLKSQDRERRKLEKQQERQVREHCNTPSYESNYRSGVKAPDLSSGTCQTPAGRELVDLYALPTSNKLRPIGLVSAHRFMCGRCVVKTACGTWALLAENPAGDWSGMYGGMTVAERKKIARTRFTVPAQEEEQAA